MGNLVKRMMDLRNPPLMDRIKSKTWVVIGIMACMYGSILIAATVLFTFTDTTTAEKAFFIMLAAILIGFAFGVVRVSDLHVRGLFTLRSAALLAATLMLCLSINLLCNNFNIRNTTSDHIKEMMGSPIGVVATVVMIPLMMEGFVRAGVIGHLLRRGFAPHWAIGTSAVLYALCHANPAHVPYGLLTGFVLGYVYWRTGSIWLTLLSRTMIYSVSLWTVRQTELGQMESVRIFDAVGGPVVANMIAVALLAAGLLIFYLINKSDNG
ncbi:MAG: CPBP family intramembrane metalloprotease [Bacteroidaceae bacterium]|nr:CPBP family intramembrane metalloprotease [Bacteroidaceae bacterium]